MIWLILGIIVTAGLFIGLGFGEEQVQEEYYGSTRTKNVLKWKVRGRQALAAVGLLICLIGFITKIPANHVGIVYSPFGGTKESTLGEGFAMKNPLDKVYKISTETQTKTVENLTTQTK